jgi:hypothetical protein
LAVAKCAETHGAKFSRNQQSLLPHFATKKFRTTPQRVASLNRAAKTQHLYPDHITWLDVPLNPVAHVSCLCTFISAHGLEPRAIKKRGSALRSSQMRTAVLCLATAYEQRLDVMTAIVSEIAPAMWGKLAGSKRHAGMGNRGHTRRKD